MLALKSIFKPSALPIQPPGEADTWSFIPTWNDMVLVIVLASVCVSVRESVNKTPLVKLYWTLLPQSTEPEATCTHLPSKLTTRGVALTGWMHATTFPAPSTPLLAAKPRR